MTADLRGPLCRRCKQDEALCAFERGCCAICTHWPDARPVVAPVPVTVPIPVKPKPADRHCVCGRSEKDCAPTWPCCLHCETWWLLQTEISVAARLAVAPVPRQWKAPAKRRRTALGALELELLPCPPLPAVTYDRGPTAQWAIAEAHRLLWVLAAEDNGAFDFGASPVGAEGVAL